MRMDTALGDLEPAKAALIAAKHALDTRDHVDASLPSLTEAR